MKVKIAFGVICCMFAFLIFTIKSTASQADRLNYDLTSNNEDFSSDQLSPFWSWVNEDITHWSLTQRSGYLRIITQQGDLMESQNDAHNILLQSAPVGDFEIQTKVDLDPTENYQQAGLVVYQDDDNYIKIVRIFSNGGTYVAAANEVNQSFSHTYIEVSPSLTTTHFRIIKQGVTYTCYYSEDGHGWVQVEQYSQNIQNIQFGLMAVNAWPYPSEIPADFDYFHVSGGFSISGHVTDETGYPIGEVLITTDSGATSITGSDGSYLLTGIPAGLVKVYPSKAGYIFYPSSLSVNLNSDKNGQNFLAIPATCGDGVMQNGSELEGGMCLLPAAEPFLYLPVNSENPPYIVLQNWDFPGGRLNSWFDHNKPTYYNDDNYVIELYDGIRLTDFYKTLPNGLNCYNHVCYDGHDGLDFHDIDKQNGEDVRETAILPAASGVVTEVCDEEKFEKGECTQDHLLGRYIIISHTDGLSNEFNGYATLYAHLASVNVVTGTVVMRNDYSLPINIGIMGSSGGNPYDPTPELMEYYYGKNPHLHFQVFFHGTNENPWILNGSQVVDPFGWLPLMKKADPWTSRPSVPLWKNFSPNSFIASSELSFLSVGGINAQIPAGAVPEGDVITLAPTSFSNLLETGLRGLGQSFYLESFSFPGQNESQTNNTEVYPAEFTIPVTVTVNFSATQLSHLIPDQAKIYWFDSASSDWVEQTTTLDLENHIATALVSQEGYFDLQAPLICPTDVTEPADDTLSWIGALPALQSDVTLSRWFDIQDDEDWFSLEGVTGISYTIQTLDLAVGVDTILTVYEPDGETIIASDDNSGGGLASLVTFHAPEGGVYYVQVSQANGSSYGCESSYQVRIMNNLQVAFLPLVELQR